MNNSPQNPASESPETTVDTLCDRLKQSGLRITQPRRALFEVLLKQEAPITIEAIHGQLNGDACDLVTVYRCMDSFEQAGLVRRIFRPSGTVMFALDKGQQEYFVMPTEGAAVKISSGPLNELSACIEKVCETLQKQGYGEVKPVVQFFAKPRAA